MLDGGGSDRLTIGMDNVEEERCNSNPITRFSCPFRMRAAYIDEAKATIFYSRALIEVNVCQEDDERVRHSPERSCSERIFVPSLISERVDGSRVNIFMEERVSRANSWMANESFLLEVDVTQSYTPVLLSVKTGNSFS